jgi:hypothetical protein
MNKVTIVGIKACQNQEGNSFIALELQGEPIVSQSATTGKFYITAKRASMPSTFDEVTANGLIGTQIPGRIEKSACPEYDYTVPETGELIRLSHRWEFVPLERPSTLRVVPDLMDEDLAA